MSYLTPQTLRRVVKEFIKELRAQRDRVCKALKLCLHQFKDEQEPEPEGDQPLPKDWIEKGWVMKTNSPIHILCGNPGCNQIIAKGALTWKFRKPHGKTTYYCHHHYAGPK